MKASAKCLVLLVVVVPVKALCDQAKPARLAAGALTLEIHVSRTAHLFHVVDQLSEWSEFCHKQYGRHFEKLDGGLTAADRELLAKHAAVRKALGWGGGLEQTFYTPLELDSALRGGVERGLLTPQQGQIEREVLSHFAERIDALMTQEQKTLAAFQKRLHDEKGHLREFASTVSRFVGGVKITVPVYLIANPSETHIGGGYNGRRLTLEVPHARDAYPSFLHELMHAFIETQRDELVKAAQDVKDLDYMTLNEGLAYALAPGIFHDGSGDPLASSVRRDVAANKPLSDNYTRFHRLGLAIRPLLREALRDDRETLSRFLPRAVDAWRVAVELDGASRDRARKITRWFSAGPGWETLAKVRSLHKVDVYFCYNHSAEGYRQILSKAAPGSKLFLLFALDHWDKDVPKEYRHLLPKPWAEIEKALKQGRTVELTGKAADLDIILLAAPTKQGLEKLIRSSKLVQ